MNSSAEASSRPSDTGRRRWSWLDRPLSPLESLAGWLVAVGAFVGVVALFGGMSEGDAAVGIYSTWAIAHGHLACAYPPSIYFHVPPIARPYTSITPFYPIFSGLLAALFRVGHQVPFPTTSQLGYHCTNAYDAIYRWSVKSSSALDTMRIGYASGVVLLAGVASVLRGAKRARRLNEPVAMLAVAVSAPVVACLLEFYHPQDLVAMGLSLFAVAAAMRQRWVWAGVAVGLAITTHQFALLVAAPLFVVAPDRRRWWFVGATAVTGAAVDLPFLLATSGRAFRAIVIGSGFTPSYGGTVLWEIGLRGAPFFLATRVLPIAVALVLAWWAQRRLGERVLEPTVLVSLVGTCLALRLVFEENLWGYYFMALAVALIVLESVRARLRPMVVAWMLSVLLAFDPLPSGFQTNSKIWVIYARVDLPKIVVGLVALYVVVSFLRRHRRWFWLAWTIAAALAFVHYPVIDFLARHAWPTWLWQVLLVPSGLALVAAPGYAVWKRCPSGADYSRTEVETEVQAVSDDLSS